MIILSLYLGSSGYEALTLLYLLGVTTGCSHANALTRYPLILQTFRLAKAIRNPILLPRTASFRKPTPLPIY